MRLLKEILLILILFGLVSAIVLKDMKISFPKIPYLVAAPSSAADPFDAFGGIATIGLVVRDTSSLDGTHELNLYDALTQAGMTVIKIDTTTMDQAVYNSSNLNWSSLSVVIICAFTDSAAVDTSVAGGIGDVPILIMEPYYWTKFGLPDSAGASAQQDSFRIHGAFSYIDTSAIWSVDDSVAFYTGNSPYYPIRNPTFDEKALLITLAGTDTIVVFDTLDAQPRMAFGLFTMNVLAENENSGFTLFNRSFARLTGLQSDTLFTIGMTSDAVTVPRGDQIPLKNHLEINGHQIKLVDTDSLGQGSYNGTGTDYADFDGFIFWAPNNGSGAEDDSVTVDVSKILTFNKAISDSLGLGTSFGQIATDSTTNKNIEISLKE